MRTRVSVVFSLAVVIFVLNLSPRLPTSRAAHLPEPGGTDMSPAQPAVWDAELAGEMAIGLINAVAVQGNHAYVGVGPRLVVLDVSDPAAPTVVSQTTVFPGTVQDIYVAGPHAYVVAGGLRVVDISDPAAPAEVATAGGAQSVYVAGTYAYAATGSALRIIDVSDPTAPAEVGYASGSAEDVHVSGDYAYVAAGENGLRVIDVSNPAAPVEVGVYDTPARDIYVAGNYAYVVAEDLRVIDVSNPASPQEVGTYKYNYETANCDFGCVGSVTASSVYVVDAIAYVTWEKCTSPFDCRVFPGLRAVDVSDPTAPVEVGRYDTWGNPSDVFVADGYAYLVERPVWWYQGGSPCTLAPTALEVIDVSNLEAIDVSNSPQLQGRGSYLPLGAATGLYVTGGYAYVADPINRLGVFDVSDPATPARVSSPLDVWYLGSSFGIGGVARDVFVTGDTVYVALGPSVSSFQAVRTLSHPATVEETRLLNGCAPPPPSQWFYRVYVQGNYAYVIDVNYTLRILRFGGNPWLGGIEVATAGNARSVYVAGNYAYAAARALRIIDVSDPTAPAEVGYASVLAEDVYVSGDYAYVAAGGAGLRVIDVSDPTAPVETGAYDTPGNASDVYVLGRYAYVADGWAGLRVVDISDPTMPVEVSAYDKVYASRVHVADGYAYVLSRDGLGYAYVLSRNGLYILRVPALVSTSISTAGGRLTSPFDRTTYTLATGTFTDTVTITHTPLPPGNAPPTGTLANIGHFFVVNAVYESTGQPAQPTRPYTVTVQYLDTEKGPAIESTLTLYRWTGAQWQREPGSVLDEEANTVTATLNHFGTWAVLGETRRMYLPAILRND